jgi:hypothetical protein
MDTSQSDFWDPLDEKLDLPTYGVSQQKLLKKLQGYQKRPYLKFILH